MMIQRRPSRENFGIRCVVARGAPCPFLVDLSLQCVQQHLEGVVKHIRLGGVVFLAMKGSCSGCPSSTATLQHGIQNLLRHFVPDVTEVRPI